MKKKTAKTKKSAAAAESPKIRPLGDRVLIREDRDSAEQKTASGIIIPAGADADKGGKRGTVVAVGPGRTENGKTIAPAVKAGDKVVFQWGDKVTIGDEELYIVREPEILAVLR